MFPASRAVRKELAPVVTSGGVAKPIIQVLIEEAVDAGIPEIAIVVQPQDKPLFEAFFKTPVAADQFSRLPPRLQSEARLLETLGRRITFLVQERPEGFGHAVGVAREWVGPEPFLLALGDHLYRSDAPASCVAQLLAACEACPSSLVGLAATPPEEVSNFGAVGAAPAESPGRFRITEFVEKPDRAYAESKLRVEGFPGRYLCLFGLYALRPAVFVHLQRLCDEGLRAAGEFQLTAALESMRRDEGCMGLVIQGRRYDTGRPGEYVKALAALANGSVTGAP